MVAEVLVETSNKRIYSSSLRSKPDHKILPGTYLRNGLNWKKTWLTHKCWQLMSWEYPDQWSTFIEKLCQKNVRNQEHLEDVITDVIMAFDQMNKQWFYCKQDYSCFLLSNCK